MVSKTDCPHIKLHCMEWSPTVQHHQKSQDWKSFCKQPEWYTFPKRFSVCEVHFERNCYKDGKLKRGAIMTLCGPVVSAVEQFRSGKVIPSELECV